MTRLNGKSSHRRRPDQGRMMRDRTGRAGSRWQRGTHGLHPATLIPVCAHRRATGASTSENASTWSGRRAPWIGTAETAAVNSPSSSRENETRVAPRLPYGGAVWGYGIETSTHIVRLMFSGVLDRFPRLRIVIGHMGEALPFWMRRLDFMGAPGARGSARMNGLKPSEYFRPNFAITTSGVEDPLALRFCIDKLGIDRVMWAIDYPFQPTASAVEFLESAQLSDEERARIAHRNAERIFRITV